MSEVHELRVPARVGLLGNPSDGYGGAAIALAIDNFGARARIAESDAVQIRVGDEAPQRWASPGDAVACELAEATSEGVRLALAALRRLAAEPSAIRGFGGERSERDGPGFTLALTSDVPRQVGLAGSSALVIATMRALLHWAGRALPADELAQRALAAEVEELGVAAGPMDRVIQAHGGLLCMDFAQGWAARSFHRRIELEALPELSIAWEPRGGESSGIVHGDLRERFERGERAVLRAIERFRGYVDEGAAALERGDHARFRELMDRNFDERATLIDLAPRDLALVTIARGCGAAAKLCGSGGAAVIAAPSPDTSAKLAVAYRDAGYAWAPVLPSLAASTPTGTAGA